MQGNRDGSWSLMASKNGGLGNGNGGYVSQATRVFSNYNVQQPTRYNFQTQQNLNFPLTQVPSFPHRRQFGAATDVEQVMRIDKIVNKMRKSLVAAGENVSSTRVSLSVLSQFQSDFWRSLGMQIQDVPSIRQLMTLEGNIIAFIHCFIGSRRIVTLHELEVAICQNESVDCFDDLELGPLLQHPLVLQYFPSIPRSTGPVQITGEEIISYLDSYLDTYHMDHVKLDEFLNFVAQKKSITSKEMLGVRIQNLRMHVSFIQDAKRQEGKTLTKLHQKYHILLSKKQQRPKARTVSEHTRFSLSSSDDNDTADFAVADVNSSDLVTSCPYPSVAEEMKQVGISNKKRKAESRNHEKSDLSKLLRRGPSKLRRGHAKQEMPKSADASDAKQVFSFSEADFTLSEGALKLFISTWKDKCKELNMSMFVEKMLSFYNLGGSSIQTRVKGAKALSSFPFVGLLHVAKELVTEALEGQLLPTEITDTNLATGYEDCAGTSSRAYKPNPLCPLPMKTGSTSGKHVHDRSNCATTDFRIRDQLHTDAAWAAQAQQTGKKGEEIAYRYFATKYGKDGLVRWVNEKSETGLPYDLVIEKEGGKKEYIEVKATVSTKKDYFNLTAREWQFANEKGESYVIAHVLLGNTSAILTQHRNLVRLLQEGLLRLLILMPNQRNEVNVTF